MSVSRVIPVPDPVNVVRTQMRRPKCKGKKKKCPASAKHQKSKELKYEEKIKSIRLAFNEMRVNVTSPCRRLISRSVSTSRGCYTRMVLIRCEMENVRRSLPALGEAGEAGEAGDVAAFCAFRLAAFMISL